MKITIENTTQVVEVNGIPCRVWEGRSETGVEVACLIPRIAVRDDQDVTQFEAELNEQRAPTAAVECFPLRMVL